MSEKVKCKFLTSFLLSSVRPDSDCMAENRSKLHVLHVHVCTVTADILYLHVHVHVCTVTADILYLHVHVYTKVCNWKSQSGSLSVYSEV